GRACLDTAGAGPPDRARSASLLLRGRGDARHFRGDARARAVVLRAALGRLLVAVLSARLDSLAVLPVRGVHWNDLGDPEGVLATRRRARTMPVRELLPVSISA